MEGPLEGDDLDCWTVRIRWGWGLEGWDCGFYVGRLEGQDCGVRVGGLGGEGRKGSGGSGGDRGLVWGRPEGRIKWTSERMVDHL